MTGNRDPARGAAGVGSEDLRRAARAESETQGQDSGVIPASFTRRVLLVIAGLTPQVVTETIYALSREGLPFLPTELWIATTGAGRREVENFLLGTGDDQVGKFFRDYGLPVPKFGDTHVLALRDRYGKALDDAHDEGAFLALGDLITARLAEWTDDPAAAVHVSLAGGRKTMSYLAGHALSLLGRPQDRLSHVLVEPPFDRISEFFYPPPKSHRIVYRHEDGCEELVDLRDAQVRFAYVPFLRLREVLPPILVEQAKSLSFSEIIERAQRSLEPPLAEIDIGKRRLYCAGVAVGLTEENFALYLVLARRGDAGITPRAEGDEDVDDYLHCYAQVLPYGAPPGGRGILHPNVELKIERWFPLDSRGEKLPIGQAPNERQRRQLFDKRAAEFSEMVARTNKIIEAALGPHLAPRYKIAGLPPKRAHQYLLPDDLTVQIVEERSERRSDDAR